MYDRLLNPLRKRSFFLFGARGTGKSTFLKAFFEEETTLYIDLLNPDLEERYSRFPREFERDILSSEKKFEWVVVDEIQKVPKILNLVHKMIENNKSLRFALTGSSARKLKRGSANLLAGRAFNYSLFPLSHIEISKDFSLHEALSFGSLPEIFHFEEKQEKQKYLKAYSQNYLRQEIKEEQLVRNLDPFRHFLDVAAQCSGKIINYSHITREIGSTVKTVQNYFQILEDTLIGFYLEPYHQSLRKSQLQSPKFYLFDCGVKRSLDQSIHQELLEGTSSYGELFEHWVIQECVRLNSYTESDYRLSYYATKNNVEIDLILTRGKEKIFVEIKSAKKVDEVKVKKFQRNAVSLKAKNMYFLSRDSRSLEIEGVKCRSWEVFLKEVFPLI